MRIQVDAEPTERYIAESGRSSLDVLYFVVAAAARTVAEDVPAMNGYLRRGRVVSREGVTVSVTAPVPGQTGLLAFPLHDAHRLSASNLARSLRRRMVDTRNRLRDKGKLAEYVLADAPWPLGRLTFRAFRGLAHIGLPMGRFDLAPESYGSLVVTSMEPLSRDYDLDTGAFDVAFVPAFPAARNASVVSVIPPRDVPAAVGGEVVVRRRVTLGFTFDHRVVDGLEVGQFISGLTRRLLDPAALDRDA